jgi:hypothetical protein
VAVASTVPAAQALVLVDLVAAAMAAIEMVQVNLAQIIPVAVAAAVVMALDLPTVAQAAAAWSL